MHNWVRAECFIFILLFIFVLIYCFTCLFQRLSTLHNWIFKKNPKTLHLHNLVYFRSSVSYDNEVIVQLFITPEILCSHYADKIVRVLLRSAAGTYLATPHQNGRRPGSGSCFCLGWVIRVWQNPILSTRPPSTCWAVDSSSGQAETAATCRCRS